jgi:hypothetical protein
MIVHITHSVPKGKLVNIPCTYRAWFMPSPASFWMQACGAAGVCGQLYALAVLRACLWEGAFKAMAIFNDGNIVTFQATFRMLIVTSGRDLFSF